jgi:hypothetical protein
VENSVRDVHRFINSQPCSAVDCSSVGKYVVSHAAILTFGKQCILVLFCLEDICIRSPPSLDNEEIELHTLCLTTVVVSYRLNSCINGNSTFND